MIGDLKSEWVQLSSKFLEDNNRITSLWDEISRYYSGKNRYYHNLKHISNMLKQAKTHQNEIIDFDTLRFAIWYHDIIYKATRKDNETKSSVFAEKRLKSMNFDQKRVKNVQKLIISTKKHEILLHENSDNAYLLDFDLSILGTDWETYLNYTRQIRKEYKIYPDFMYNSGRKKVLQTFLERKSLYFTETYKMRFEAQARKNLNKEISQL